MKLFWNNLVDYSNVVITSRSAASGTAATNVAHDHRKRVWRTSTTYDSDWVSFDLVAAKTATSIIILDHNFVAGDEVVLEGSNNPTFADGFSQALPYATGTIIAEFESQSFRYWRVTFSKAAGSARQIGRIFLGESYTAPMVDNDGYDETCDDYSVQRRGPHGQEYNDVRSSYRMIKVDFSHVSSAEIDDLLEFGDRVGKHRPFFFRMTDTGTTSPVVYCRLEKRIGRKAYQFDRNGEQGWKASMQVREIV